MLKYFLILDSFGINMSFYLRGYKDYRSHFGGLVTIIIYIVTIICGIIFSNQIFTKKNPKVNTTSAIYKNPTKASYPDNLFFMVGLNVDSLPFVNESIYRPIGYIRTKINGTEDFLLRKISLDICSNIFDEKYKYYDSIKHINLHNFYCYSLDNKDELFINEFWDHEGFQMLQIKLYNCSALAENKSECAPNDIIQEKLQSPIVTFYSLKNYIDTNNYQNPFIHGLEESFYYVSYKKFISATQYLKHIQIKSDIGYLFEKFEISEDCTIDSNVEYSEYDQEDGKIFTMSIQLTNKIDIYNRSYYKIQDLGADIGAIYGALHMVLQILFRLYNSSKLFTNIINDFFLIKEDYKPIGRDKKSFITLKNKFYNKAFKLNLSLKGQNSYNNNHNNTKIDYISYKNEDYIKTLDTLENSDNRQKILNSNEKIFNANKTYDNNINSNININDQKINITNSIRNSSCSMEKSHFFLNIIKNKKEEEKKRITINFSFVDRFIFLYIIDPCRNRANRYSYYNLYYKGKDYIENVLDINNYIKYNHFLKMYFLLDGKETKELYDYICTPILASNYVGPRLEIEE